MTEGNGDDDRGDDDNDDDDRGEVQGGLLLRLEVAVGCRNTGTREAAKDWTLRTGDVKTLVLRRDE
jgi:hypothetical protein